MEMKPGCRMPASRVKCEASPGTLQVQGIDDQSGRVWTVEESLGQILFVRKVTVTVEIRASE